MVAVSGAFVSIALVTRYSVDELRIVLTLDETMGAFDIACSRQDVVREVAHRMTRGRGNVFERGSFRDVSKSSLVE